MPKEQVDEARKWCDDCPVRRDCFIYAFQAGEKHGIWAGLTARERKRTRVVTSSLPIALSHFEQGSLYGLVVKL